MLTRQIRLMHGPLYTALWQKLSENLSPTELTIRDTSQAHAEHEAMRSQGHTETHFEIDIRSEAFRGKTAVERHRMVYSQMHAEFSKGLHAVTIKAKTPDEMK